MKHLGVKVVLIAGLLLAMVAISGVYGWNRFLDAPSKTLSEAKIVQVQPGSGLKVIAREFEEQGIWNHSSAIVLYTRFFQRNFLPKAGEYRISAGATPRQIIQLLDKGDTLLHRLIFIEGETLDQILFRLESNTVVTRVITDDSPGLSVQLDSSYASLEGWLFPDTYFFSRGDTDIDILRRAYAQMVEVLDIEWENRASGLPYENSYEALIMASLVERETGVPEEREQIAGVFVRRLQNNMRLQTDPSVIYGMGARYKGNLKKSDLRDDTPYNTYTRHGLPPTPIAMPGRAAIYAALHPAPGSALYFVAKGDGSHHFSDTLEEHLQAVQRYQVMERRADYTSMPANSTEGNNKG